MAERKKVNGAGPLDAYAELFAHLITHTENDSMDACPHRAFRLRQQWLKSSGTEREAYFIQMTAEMQGLRRNRRFDEFTALLNRANTAAGIVTTESPSPKRSE
jgi:hypothetical protein